MREFVADQTLAFREETTRRMLHEFYEAGDIASLLDASLLLNTLWHHQAAISKWLAHEAAENLGEAWQALLPK